MLCSKCGAENPAEARYCRKCGAAIISGPPIIPVSPTEDLPAPRVPLPRKSRLTPPLIIVGAVVILLGLGGLIALVHYANSRRADLTDYSGDSTFPNATMPSPGYPPSPSKFEDNPPMNTANTARPQFTQVSDELYAQRLIGAWTGRKMMSGALVETLAIYSPGGYGNWTGTVTYLGQQTYFAMRVSWGVKNGTFRARVEMSNIPQLMPVGFISESKIISVTDTEWTYVDALDQTTVTVTRVGGNRY